MSGAVTLREWESRDAQAVFEACQDETIRARLPVPDPYLLTDAESFLGAVVPGIIEAGGVARAILLDGEVVGSITLRPTPDGAGRRGRVGYWVASCVRGRGVAPQALAALGPELARYQEVELLTARDNLASQAVARKCGFECVQEIASEPLTGGKPALRFLRRTPPRPEEARILQEGSGALTYPGAHSLLPAGTGAIALTFDDGPDPIYTPQVLDLLRARETRATFFVLGEAVARHPEIVSQIRDEGHLIGVHGYDHVPMLEGRGLDGLDRCVAQLQALGIEPEVFRPAYGDLDEELLGRAGSLGLTTWLWSVDSYDWCRAPAPILARRVLEHAGPGAVVLLHDGRGERSMSVGATALILEHVEELTLLAR